MSPPFDLTRRFGEGWCVTVARLTPEQALYVMGVEAPVELRDGLAQASERIPARPRNVLLLAKAAPPDSALVLELEGTTGWIGMDPDVLGELSDAGGTACTISRDPNKVQVIFAEDGRYAAQLSAVTFMRWGRFGDRLAAALRGAGFPEGNEGEPSEELSRWTSSQCAALALEAATGVYLTEDLLSDPWIGGPSVGVP
jgi:hypothetical protein